MGDPGRFCLCSCHNVQRANQRGALMTSEYPEAFRAAQKAQNYLGVNTATDHVAAVWACARCENAHVAVMWERRIWGPRIVREPVPPSDADQGEGPE